MVRESKDNHLQADKTIYFPTSSVFDRLNDSTRNMCHAIDPGCENPAEAALLWLVRSISPFPSLTQVHIEVRGRHYYADIVIADLRIIIEFDGIGKLGDNQSDLARAKREWIRRDEDLRDAGWNIVRVSWPDYNDWEGLRLRLMRALGRTSSSLDHRLLWSPPIDGLLTLPRALSASAQYTDNLFA